MTDVQVNGIPLDDAVLCLDCETIYILGTPACPRCASRAWALLAQWLRTAHGRLV